MIFAVKGKSASFCRTRRLPSSFSKFVLASRGWCTRPGEHCLQWTRRPTTGRWCVRARSINNTVLASGHWRTTQAGDLFIAEIPRFAVVERQKNFRFFPSLNDAYTNTATGEEAIAPVKVRCKLRWRSPEQTRVSCFFGFANVTNTFHACKRNAVHTSATKEQTLTNTFELVHCKQRKKKSVKQGTSNYRAYCRARLGGSGVGRIDKRSHFLDRAEPMGGSAQRWTGLRVWEISLQRSTPRSPWKAIRFDIQSSLVVGIGWAQGQCLAG